LISNCANAPRIVQLKTSATDFQWDGAGLVIVVGVGELKRENLTQDTILFVLSAFVPC